MNKMNTSWIKSGIKRSYYSANMNEAELNKASIKSYADKKVDADIKIKNEKDPLKRKKMECRIVLGVTDFDGI